MSFKISDSYTTCSVWLTFCIVVKKVQWSCTLKIPWKKNYLYWRNMLLYIPSNKKQYSCKGKYNLWKQCNTFFNEVWPHYHFFSMAFAFNKGISLLQKELPWRQDIPEIENTIRADIQYINKCKTFLMKWNLTVIFLYNICMKRKNSTS